jgi:3D (Asp-Asp-Asp) domain-containing protein
MNEVKLSAYEYAGNYMFGKDRNDARKSARKLFKTDQITRRPDLDITVPMGKVPEITGEAYTRAQALAIAGSPVHRSKAATPIKEELAKKPTVIRTGYTIWAAFYDMKPDEGTIIDVVSPVKGRRTTVVFQGATAKDPRSGEEFPLAPYTHWAYVSSPY